MKKMKLDIQLFNGSVAIQTITETTDINTNASTFTIPAKMTTTGATYNNSNASMTLQWKYASASSWTTISKQTFKIGKNSSVTKNWTLSLTHNADGTLENVQFRVQWYITDSTNGTTGATTFTPTTIPRVSNPTLSSSSVNMGSSVTITTNRYSSSFTHTITYAFGSASGTIATNVGASTTWTPPLTLANQIPNATSGTGTITCITYNGSTEVGRKTINITLNVPTSVVPTISSMTLQENGDVPSSWGVYVQNKSKIKVTYSASGAYSSTISSYTTTADGYTYTGNAITINYIRTSGNITIGGKVVDSRSRQATTSQTPYIYPYSNPTISTAQVQRCDVNGNIDNNGEYMYISFGGSISPANNKNTPSAVYKVGYRVHNTGNYTYVNLTTNANSYSASGILFTNGIKAASSSGTKVQFSTNNTYDIQFYVKDYFMEYTNVQFLDAGFDLMNFNPSGKAMAIGKVSEAGANEEKLEIALETYMNNTINIDNIDFNKMIFKRTGKTTNYASIGLGTDSFTLNLINSSDVLIGRLQINDDGTIYNYITNERLGYTKPDYANAIFPLSENQTSGTFSYTAPSDGIIYITMSQTTRTFCNVQIIPNGSTTSITMGAMVMSIGTGTPQMTQSYVLGKGDTITVSALSTVAFIVYNRTEFVPYM